MFSLLSDLFHRFVFLVISTTRLYWLPMNVVGLAETPYDSPLSNGFRFCYIFRVVARGCERVIPSASAGARTEKDVHKLCK